ncbi:MAG: S8 family serine peptidase [Bacteroidia bacterium]|nr:S8 family serine peptidase [Bacteroidia bacterium]
MRKKIIQVVCVAALVYCPGRLAAQQPVAAYRTDRVLVRPLHPSAAATLAPLRGQARMTPGHQVDGWEVWYLAPGQTPEALAEILGPQVAVVPDHLYQAAALPNDPLLSQQWGLQNTGQLGGTPGSDIAAADAWGIAASGSGSIVGIIDAGIDWRHPDLAENIWQNLGEDKDGDGRVLEKINGVWQFDPGDVDGIDQDGNGYPDDFIGWDFVNQDNDPSDDHVFGHGTHVAGIVAARGHNGIGIAGVAWQARLMALKFLDANGIGSASGAASAIQYATQMGAHITNNSWGGGADNPAVLAAIQAARNAGQLFVAAAGNNFGNNNDRIPLYPAAYPLDNIITVTATDPADRLADFANVGAATVDLGAPGYAIFSTLPGGQYGYLGGTSMAAPYVAGALCLIREVFPGSTYQGLGQRLLRAVEQIPALHGKCASSGRLNIYRALARPPRYRKSWADPTPAQAIRIIELRDHDLLTLVTRSGGLELTRLSTAGSVRWSHFLPATGSEGDITQLDNGSLLVCGTLNQHVYMACLDSLGGVLWDRSLSGGTSGGQRLGVTPTGWILAATVPGGTGTGLLLIQGNTSGQLTASRLFTVPGQSLMPEGIRYDEGSLLCWGKVTGTGPTAFFMTSLDASLNPVWTYQYQAPAGGSFMAASALARISGDDEDDDDEMAHWLLNGTVQTGNDTATVWLTFGMNGDQLTGFRASGVGGGVSLDLLPDGGWVTAVADLQPVPVLSRLEFDPAGTLIRVRRYETDNQAVQPADMTLTFDAGTAFLATLPQTGEWMVVRTDREGYSGCPDETPVVVIEGPVWLTQQPLVWQSQPGGAVWQGAGINPVAISAIRTDRCDNSTCTLTAAFAPSALETCTGAPVTMTNQSTGALAYEWRIDSVLVSTDENPVLSFSGEGLAEVSLTVINGDCRDETALFITVDPPISLNLNDTTRCAASLLLDAGVDALQYAWYDSNAQLIGSGRSIRFTQSGDYELAVTDVCGNQVTEDFVVNLQPGCVWPGDINADGEVTITDFLALGFAAGQTGPVRPGATTAYTSQTAPDWTGFFPAGLTLAPGINLKHADADGNGTINLISDGQIVRQNATPASDPVGSTAANSLSCSLLPQQSTVTAGTPVSFELRLEDPGTGPVQNAYGMSVRLNYNLPVQFDPAVETDTSWMNTQPGSLQALTIPYPSQRRLDMGLTRTNLTGAIGAGRIARACCITVVIDDIGSYLASAPEAFLSVSLSQAQLVRADGTVVPVNNLNAQGFGGVRIRAPQVRVQLQALLQGAFEPGTGKMRTDLVQAGLLPLSSPYQDSAAVVSHAPDIVDWVEVQLRDPQQPGMIQYRRSALLAADGDILDPETRSVLRLPAPDGMYLIAVAHRNHLPVMGAAPVWLARDSVFSYSFATGPAQAAGPEAQAEVAAGRFALRAGDINQDRQVQASGEDNDRRLIILRLGGQVGATLTGYYPEDLNLDGVVDYLGAGSDRATIMSSVGEDQPTRIRTSLVP